MAITWSPKLAVGITLIDGQHQELFRRVNALLEAMATGHGRERLRPTVAFLDAYVHEHFRDEEALMRAKRYPLLESHLGSHGHFVAEFRKIAAALEEDDDAGARLTVRTSALLCDWLREHVATSDRDFGRFLQTRSPGVVAG